MKGRYSRDANICSVRCGCFHVSVHDELLEEWEWGPSEDVLDDCRYQEARCAAEILVDEEAAALDVCLTAAEREDAVEELLETGVVVRFEEDRGGDSFTPVFETASTPRQAIESAKRRRTWSRPRSAVVVRRAPIRRSGRRAVRRHRRLVRRAARAPGRSEDPHEDPLTVRGNRGGLPTGGGRA
jgi:hypothetical protein